MSLTALLPSLDPALVTIICAIFLFAGVVKGFLGIGLPAAAMGLLTLVIPPTEAISLLWLPILFTNIINDYPTALLTVAIGSAMVIFSLNLLFGVTVPIGPGPVWQGAFGVVAGVLGGLSSIWSPPVAMYLIARDTPKERFIGAAGFLFLAGCVPLGIGLVMSGLITWVVIVKSSLGLATTLIGFRVGEIMRERVSQHRFRQIVLVAFLLMGLRLIAVGLL